MSTYTLKKRALALYEAEIAARFDDRPGEFDADDLTGNVTRALLGVLLDLPPDVAEGELNGIVSGWCRERERSRAEKTYRDGSLFPMPDHVFVLGEGQRVFARDTEQRHLVARVRVVTENVQRQLSSANAELTGLSACQSALADAPAGSTLSDVGALDYDTHDEDDES